MRLVGVKREKEVGRGLKEREEEVEISSS